MNNTIQYLLNKLHPDVKLARVCVCVYVCVCLSQDLELDGRENANLASFVHTWAPVSFFFTPHCAAFCCEWYFEWVFILMIQDQATKLCVENLGKNLIDQVWRLPFTSSHVYDTFYHSMNWCLLLCMYLQHMLPVRRTSIRRRRFVRGSSLFHHHKTNWCAISLQALHTRCISILAHLWHAPHSSNAVGTFEDFVF